MGTGLKQLCHYFWEMRRHATPSASPASGFMALREVRGSEDDLIAILDTGCNATRHGSHWYVNFVKATGCPDADLQVCQGSKMKGIGGNMRVGGKRLLEVCFELNCGSFARGTLPSLELMGSHAPLLLSLESQRQLGFKIDVANHVVYSTALQSELKLVQRDGLLAIRLIPSYLGLNCTITEECPSRDDEPSMKDEYDAQEPEPGQDDMTGNLTNDEPELTPEVHLAVDELNKTALTRGQKRQLNHVIEDVKDKGNHL